MIDGAPADVVARPIVPNKWHALATIVAPTQAHVESFARAIQVEGRALNHQFELRKWRDDRLRSDRRAQYQKQFTDAFTTVFRQYPMISAYVYASQEQTMHNVWEPCIAHEEATQHIREYLDERNRQMVEFGPIADEDPITHCKMTKEEGVGIIWNVLGLNTLRELVHPWAVWHLRTDKMPGGGRGIKGVRVMRHFLKLQTNNLLRLEIVREDEGIDYLADCVAGWSIDWLTKPESRERQKLNALFDDRKLTERFWLTQRTYPPPDSTIPS